MSTSRRADISATLRQRVLSAVHFRTLAAGQRLPSARVLAGELDADPRVILAAYRHLEHEGLIERRPPSRSFFVAAGQGAGAPAPTEEWLVDVLAEGLARGVRAPDFPEHARRSLETLRLRAACVECNRDQLVWLCRELQEDYGIVATGVEVDALREAEALPAAVRSADLLLTTTSHAAAVRPVAERLGRPLVVVSLRADLAAEIARLLALGPVYVIGTDPRLADKLRRSFAGQPDAAHVRPVILGRDDVADVPAGAPAYVMRTARDVLGGVPPHLRPFATLRTFDMGAQRAILHFVVRANRAALASLPYTTSTHDTPTGRDGQEE